MVLVNCILLISGQLLWKTGLQGLQLNNVRDIVAAMFNKYIFSGIVIYVVATGYWLYVLKRYDLTKVYPLQSMSYILVLLAGFFLLKEPVTKHEIFGTIIICIGVYVIAQK